MSAESIYKETYGNGPDLVLLHGWGFHSNIWSSILKPLRKHFRVTLVDLPGFGRSTIVPATYTLSTLVDVMLDALPQKAMYMAWSLGSFVAQTLAVKKPERVSQLVSVCASPRFVASEHWPGVSIKLFQQFKQGIDGSPQRALKSFASMLSLSGSNPKLLSLQLCEKIFEYGMPEQNALIAGLQILRETDMRNTCGKIQCPQSYILGSRDPLVDPSMSGAIKHILPSCHVVQIDGAGHIPFVTHTQQFLQIILPLLQDNEF